MTATRVPAEIRISEARAILTDIATASKEHEARTMLTRHDKPVAVVMHPDAINCPTPSQWAAARHTFNQAMTDPQQHREAVLALGKLLRSWYHGGNQEPTAQTCGHCGTPIRVTVSGTNWVDAGDEGHCPGTDTSHEPAVTS
jgi:hypothetical protein